MKLLLYFIILLFLTNCSNNKFVYICGDRECIDKKEADEYFSKNLTLEVKILNKDKNKSVNLVKINTTSPDEISLNNNISSKETNIRELSKEEKKIINERRKLAKRKIKEQKKKEKRLSKINQNEVDKLIKKNDKKIKLKKVKAIYVDTHKLCLDFNKCDIDEISEYLIKAGNEKSYPNISKY